MVLARLVLVRYWMGELGGYDCFFSGDGGIIEFVY